MGVKCSVHFQSCHQAKKYCVNDPSGPDDTNSRTGLKIIPYHHACVNIARQAIECLSKFTGLPVCSGSREPRITSTVFFVVSRSNFVPEDHLSCISSNRSK